MQKIVASILCFQFFITTGYGSANKTLMQETLNAFSYSNNESGPKSNKKISRTKKIILLSALLAGGVVVVSCAGYYGIKMIKSLSQEEEKPEEQPSVFNSLKVQIGATVLDVASEHFLSEPTGKKASHLINRVATFIDKLETDPINTP